ncbi:MAG: PVC-type heme-binding CxxCH protein [Planctomycetaceae bacterium]
MPNLLNIGQLLVRGLLCAAVIGAALGAFGLPRGGSVHAQEAAAPPLVLPEGFQAALFADDDLAHDIYSLTLNGQGEVVVSGPGYIKTLKDTNGDGKADTAKLFSSLPKSGAHGLLFVDSWLFATGDDCLLRFADANNDGEADGPPVVVAKLASSEHGASGLVLGPDGWLYMTCGNDSKVNTGWQVAPSSPLSVAESGAIVRMTLDGAVKEIVAEGFRNPYDLAFDGKGRIYTVDSDGERDHHLPWYEPTRAFDVSLGAHHGWLLQGWQQSWSRPEWMADNVPRQAEFGRGSPTGVTVYRHKHFPEKYQGGLFAACWTLGRIYHVPLKEQGLSNALPESSEVFLQTAGTVGFAPVDMAIGPTGEMFVAIGGRRTRGGVFRISFTAATGTQDEAAVSSLEGLLNIQDPQVAWARTKWRLQMQKTSRAELLEAAKNSKRVLEQRLRAIELLTEFHGGLLLEESRGLLRDSPSELAAKVLWSTSRTSSHPATFELFLNATNSESLVVQRAGWEGLLCLLKGSSENLKLDDAWIAEAGFEKVWKQDDARLFDLARRVLIAQQNLQEKPTAPAEAGFDPLLFAKGPSAPFDAMRFARLAALLQPVDPNLKPTLAQQLRIVRQLQKELGDVYIRGDDASKVVGYSANATPEVLTQARENLLLPILIGQLQGSVTVEHQEAARLAAMMQVPAKEVAPRLLVTLDERSNVVRDLHFLFCLSQLEGELSPAGQNQVATALLRLFHKMKEQGRQPSRNWPQQVQALAHRFMAKQPAIADHLLASTLLSLPEQAPLFRDESQEIQQKAIRKLLAACRQGDEPLVDVATSEMVSLIAVLPKEERLPIVRELWGNVTLRDGLVPLLVDANDPQDRQRFMEGLQSFVPATQEKCAAVLEKMPAPSDLKSPEILAVLAALRQACATPEQRSTRQALVSLLQTWTQQTFPLTPPGKKESPADYQPWFAWEKENFPEAEGAGGDDSWSSWNTRLSSIPWEMGDAKRGEEVFKRQSCVKCHAGSGPLGPSLIGVQKRFSREDLLRTIVEPNRDVAPPYQVWQAITRDGQVYSGLLVYESPEGTLLQTSPEETVRIAGDNLETLRRSSRSLMPQGLLKGVTDPQIADLMAYLQQISAK